MSLPGNLSNLARLPSPSSSAFGDVDGPSSATNNAVAVFNGTTGKIIKNSTTIADATGINGTVGATTPAAGSFTTLSATGLMTGSAGFTFTGTSGTAYQLMRSIGATNNPVVTVSATESTKDITWNASGSTGGFSHVWQIENVEKARLNSTGLAVTGTLTSTGLFGCGGSTPASAAASGTAGTITWDSSYIYVCTATNTWKRVAIATW